MEEPLVSLTEESGRKDKLLECVVQYVSVAYGAWREDDKTEKLCLVYKENFVRQENFVLFTLPGVASICGTGCRAPSTSWGSLA